MQLACASFDLDTIEICFLDEQWKDEELLSGDEIQMKKRNRGVKSSHE